ncbi:hypothetical protein LCGC14_0605630 [marine sediment metagenome]|uniref:Uncharacterized protein n=2 Tax=root TaxID=1 RepID=A0A9C9NI07_9HYPH|nr:hypothetical protein [Aurantimonas coralicida]
MLPGSRDFTAVDSGPLPAATVNNIQDEIIGRGHGSIDGLFPIDAVRTINMTFGALDFHYEFAGVESTDRIWFTVPLRPGDRLLEWAVFVRDDLGPPVDRMAVTIREADPLAGWSQAVIGSQQISDGSGTDQKIGEVLGAPHVVLADKPVDVSVIADPAGALNAGNILRLYPVIYLRWDHP